MKLALFMLVALLSIPPTLHYFGRSAASYGAIRRFQAAQLAVFFAIPLCASLMARGVYSTARALTSTSAPLIPVVLALAKKASTLATSCG